MSFHRGLRTSLLLFNVVVEGTHRSLRLHPIIVKSLISLVNRVGQLVPFLVLDLVAFFVVEETCPVLHRPCFHR